MKSYILEYVQSVLANAPTMDELGLDLEEAGFKLAEGILAGLFVGVVFYLAARLRKEQAYREDGWYYVTPGFAARFVLIGTALISLGTLAGAILAIKTGYYRPTLEGHGLGEIGLFAFFIGGFGALAIACYIFYFRHKVRWNHTYVEKIAGHRTTRIAWKDVRAVRQDKGADHLWIISDKSRIRVWTHMNGVGQLVAAIDGTEEALGLLRQIKPFIEGKPRPEYAGSFDPHER